MIAFDPDPCAVCTRDRDSIQLQDYTGISISWLVSKIQMAGVTYREITVERWWHFSNACVWTAPAQTL